MYPIYFFAVALIFSLVDIAFFSGPVAESALRWVVVWCVGVQALYAFLGHFFKADEVARSIGWPTGNPFQTEIAFCKPGRCSGLPD